MQHPIFIFLFSMMMLTITGCGFHLRNVIQIPFEFRAVMLQSDDSYSLLTRRLRQQLHLNKITTIDGNTGTSNTRIDLPIFRIITEKQEYDTISIFKNGMIAEYSIVISVYAQLIIPNKGTYPINITICRSCFDKPSSVIARDAEQNIILDEMHQCLAEQLVRKLLSVYTTHLLD